MLYLNRGRISKGAFLNRGHFLARDLLALIYPGWLGYAPELIPYRHEFSVVPESDKHLFHNNAVSRSGSIDFVVLPILSLNTVASWNILSNLGFNDPSNQNILTVIKYRSTGSVSPFAKLKVYVPGAFVEFSGTWQFSDTRIKIVLLADDPNPPNGIIYDTEWRVNSPSFWRWLKIYITYDSSTHITRLYAALDYSYDPPGSRLELTYPNVTNRVPYFSYQYEIESGYAYNVPYELGMMASWSGIQDRVSTREIESFTSGIVADSRNPIYWGRFYSFLNKPGVRIGGLPQIKIDAESQTLVDDTAEASTTLRGAADSFVEASPITGGTNAEISLNAHFAARPFVSFAVFGLLSFRAASELESAVRLIFAGNLELSAISEANAFNSAAAGVWPTIGAGTYATIPVSLYGIVPVNVYLDSGLSIHVTGSVFTPEMRFIMGPHDVVHVDAGIGESSAQLKPYVDSRILSLLHSDSAPLLQPILEGECTNPILVKSFGDIVFRLDPLAHVQAISTALGSINPYLTIDPESEAVSPISAFYGVSFNIPVWSFVNTSLNVNTPFALLATAAARSEVVVDAGVRGTIPIIISPSAVGRVNIAGRGSVTTQPFINSHLMIENLISGHAVLACVNQDNFARVDISSAAAAPCSIIVYAKAMPLPMVLPEIGKCSKDILIDLF